jgi:hypothetical protein
VIPGVPVVTKPVEPEPSKLRTWTNDKTGTSIEAEFLSYTAGKVKLRKADGTVVTVPMDLPRQLVTQSSLTLRV